MRPSILRLKKGEERRIRAGHPWIFSNEIDTAVTPLKAFSPGEEVLVEAHDKSIWGIAYVNPHSLIAARIMSRQADACLNKDFFIHALGQAMSLRERLFDKPYYRMVFSEADNLPGLIIDRFNNDFVFQVNTAGMEMKQAILVDALSTLIPHTQSILLRNDSQIREQEGLTTYIKPALGTPPDETRVIENEVQFNVSLWKGQKTGWFYDHRLNRARLKHYVKEQTVLDVFSYLGGFGIQAAVFGASQVDCIEASQSACHHIMNNAQLNQVAKQVNVLCDDAFDAMKSLLHAQKQYDVIVLDPPAFVKKFKDKKEGWVAYQRLNELALKLLKCDGILVTCSCSMHISMEDFIELLKRAAYRTKSHVQLLERGHQGPDHPIHLSIPETDYLKALFIRKTA